MKRPAAARTRGGVPKVRRLHANHGRRSDYLFVGRLFTRYKLSPRQIIDHGPQQRLSGPSVYRAIANFKKHGSFDPFVWKRQKRLVEREARRRALRHLPGAAAARDARRKHGLQAIPRHVVYYILAQLERDPALFTGELQHLCERRFGVVYAMATIDVEIRAAGFTPKVLEERAMERDAFDRHAFEMRIKGVDPRKIIWVDETLRNRYTGRRRRGRSRRGKSAVRLRRFLGHDTANWTLFAAMNVDGFIVPACLPVKGNCSADEFLFYFRSCLLPLVERGTVIVLDNASTHHAGIVAAELEAAVAERGGRIEWLPAYSPVRVAFCCLLFFFFFFVFVCVCVCFFVCVFRFMAAQRRRLNSTSAKGR